MVLWKPALLVAAALLAALVPQGAGGSPGYDPPPPTPGGPAAFEELLERAELPSDTRVFLRAVARRESNFNPRARNDSPSEVAAGRRAIDDPQTGALAKGFFQGNEHIQEFREFGSGGLFGLLGRSGLAAGGKDGPFRYSSPYVLFQPEVSLVCYLAYLARVMGWSSFKAAPTWGTLRVGGASPGLMSNLDSEAAKKVLRRFRGDLEATGADPSFADKPVTGLGFPGTSSLLAKLGGIA